MIADLALALILAWWSVTVIAVVLVRRLLRNPQALMAKVMRQRKPFTTGVNAPPIKTGANG